MNTILFVFVFTFVVFQSINGEPFEDEDTSMEEINIANELRLQMGTTNCTQTGFFCKSCSELSMCIETDFGWTEQHVETCSGIETCYLNRCTSQQNPFCDGTMDIPFKCHGPGAFPDPFDCQSYHLCVSTTETQNNATVEVLKDFKHTCPNDGDQKYRYDPKSTYCKYEINDKCPYLPVPICDRPGSTGPLLENDSIYYICEEIYNVTYPNLYACPHGKSFDIYTKRCGEHLITTTPYTTTAYTTTPYTTTTYPTTTYPTTTYPTTTYPTTTYPTTTHRTTTYPTTTYPTTTYRTTTYPPS